MRPYTGAHALAAFAVLLSAAAHAQRAPDPTVISVGANVQVSKQFPKLMHQESWAAGDPDHAGRLMACSQVEHEDMAARGQHCYSSFDGGKTWTTVLELDKGPLNGDPVITYGRGDTTFVVVLTFPQFGDPGFKEGKRFTNIYRSLDGGRTFAQSASFGFIDREAIVVDETNGKYAGRIYITGATGTPGISGGASSVHLYRSLDGGSTFLGPAQRGPQESGARIGRPSTNVVLSDGTVAFLAAYTKPGRSSNLEQDRTNRTANEQLQLFTSTDGGETLNPPVTVTEWYVDRLSSEGSVYAVLASDPGSRFFKDRLYAVWPDISTGRIDIRFSYSADKGKTWSPSIRVNDDPRPQDAQGRGPDHIVPTVAVNKAGVVLVVWYDRRESGDDMGWKMRAAASLDGGVTFSPSAVVSDAAHAYTPQTEWIQGSPGISGGGGGGRGGGDGRGDARGRPISVNLRITSFFLGGHTSGIAVDADGVFHPAWVDNRTGITHIWTAPVTVRGTVERNGASELADLDDITENVAMEAQSTHYDRASSMLTLRARLRNMSKNTVRGPMKVRVVGLTSQLGVPTVVGAANGATSIGAIWDFGGAGGLMPDSTTTPVTLTFRLSDVRPIRLVRESPGFTSGLVQFEARVYGKGGASTIP